MKIRIMTGMYGYLDSHGRYRTARDGDTVDVAEAEAERLFSLRLAVPYTEEKNPGEGKAEAVGEAEDTGAGKLPGAVPADPAEKPAKTVSFSRMKVSELRKRCEEAGAWGCDHWTKDECIGYLTEAEKGEDIIV